MGVHSNIALLGGPRQSDDVGRRVLICFNYDTNHRATGVIVRDDIEEPGRTIFKLDDGRYLLSTECQWTYAEFKPKGPDGKPL